MCLRLPASVEGSARVVFEALAAGCYVITTPNAGSIVKDEVHGALVEPGSADGLPRHWFRLSQMKRCATQSARERNRSAHAVFVDGAMENRFAVYGLHADGFSKVEQRGMAAVP